MGAYVLVSAPKGASASTTTTLTFGHSTTSSQSGIQGGQNYKGSFQYISPLGPSGINDSSGKPIQWNSTQSASGSFVFSIDPSTYQGTGTGQGSITVTTRGYCTGTVIIPYTFTIQVVHAPGENFIISFNTPTPSTAMVQLTCQGSTVGFYTANNPVPFLSVYPNGLSEPALPATASQQPTGGISYTVAITAGS